MHRCKLAALAVAIAATSFGFARFHPAPAQDAAMASPLVEEHKMFAKYAGIWDAEVEMASQEPGGAPQKNKGVATCKVGCGGLWLLTDFEGTMMGMPFIGHEVTGYDATQKKYTLTWVDSWTPTAATGTGHFDAATKTLHTQVAGLDGGGAPMAFHGTDVWSDADHRTWSMLMKGPDGSEFPAITMKYTRRK